VTRWMIETANPLVGDISGAHRKELGHDMLIAYGGQSLMRSILTFSGPARCNSARIHVVAHKNRHVIPRGRVGDVTYHPVRECRYASLTSSAQFVTFKGI
jgi:hypothetical protein